MLPISHLQLQRHQNVNACLGVCRFHPSPCRAQWLGRGLRPTNTGNPAYTSVNPDQITLTNMKEAQQLGRATHVEGGDEGFGLLCTLGLKVHHAGSFKAGEASSIQDPARKA